ncbi:hypothetical protein J3D46_004779 [Paenarthrobacter sp. A20]|nr:hypothetical protein [Paenarthrobacter sp. A20]
MLHHLMHSFQRDIGQFSSKDVYCGLTPKQSDPPQGPLVKSEQHATVRDSAYIQIDLRYLEMSSAVTDAGVVFKRLVAESAHQPGQNGQNMINGTRETLFKHVGKDYPGEHQTYWDQGQFWRQQRGTKHWKDLTRSALLFTMAHELDHLFRRDPWVSKRAQIRARGRLVASQQAVQKLWPTAEGDLSVKATQAHQDEIMADHGAVELAGTAALRAGLDLKTVMQGSFISMGTLALDGWFMNQSKPSSSHPSSFARTFGLLPVWSEFLQNQNEQGWPEVRQPTRADLAEVAALFVMVDWIAGRYRAHREGKSR